MTPENILTNYEDARAASGGITADFFCGSSLVTTAGQPGSLVESDACSAITFDSSRPALWDIPVPTGSNTVTSPPLVGCGKDGCQTDLSQSLVDEPTVAPSSPTEPLDPATLPTSSASSQRSNIWRYLEPLALLVPMLIAY